MQLLVLIQQRLTCLEGLATVKKSEILVAYLNNHNNLLLDVKDGGSKKEKPCEGIFSKAEVVIAPS